MYHNHLLRIFQKFHLGFSLIALVITVSGGILILPTKSYNDKEIKENNIPDRRIRDNIAHNTGNAVEEDGRQKLVRTKRSQKKYQECKKRADESFMYFVENFQRHWEERISNITQLKEGYVSAC